MKKFLVPLFFLIASPALAANQCYSPAELQAEQLLRLHSELMVITVTCRQGSDGESLVPVYTGFTRNNIAALRDAEQTMMHYYKMNYGGDGVERLDILRTRLGNEFGQKIARISAPVFCDKYRDKVVAIYNLDSGELRAEVGHMAATEKSYNKLCRPADAHIAKQGQ